MTNKKKSKKDEYQLTREDAVEILKTNIQILRELGFKVGLRDAPQSDTRPPGMFIFVSGLTFAGNKIELLQSPAKIFAGNPEREQLPQNENLPQKVES